MSTPTPIGSWMVVKKAQYVEEASFGVAPASPIYALLGRNTALRVSLNSGLEAIPQPGSEDPQTIINAYLDQYWLDLTYRPIDTTFAKYVVNAQGGRSGSIDKSLDITISAKFAAGNETFLQALGCRGSSLSIGGTTDQQLQIRTRIASQTIKSVTQSGTYAAESSGRPLMWKDGGTRPVSIAGTTYPVNNLNITVDRTLDWIPQPGSILAQDIKPTTRVITGTIGLVWTSLDNYSRIQPHTPFSMVWTIKTGQFSLTLNNAQFTRLQGLNLEAEKTIYETYSLEAPSATLV